MPFNVAYGFRMNVRFLQSIGDQSRLRIWIRSQISVRAPAMIESARSNDAVNMVIMFQRFAQRLQQDRAYSFSGNKSISSLPITLTFAVERQHPAGTERLVFVRMQIEIDAACNGALATPIADAFTREMESH